MNFKVQNHIYRGKYNELCSVTCLVVNGRPVKPKVTGIVWAYRRWTDGKTRYSSGDRVMKVNGVDYRIGQRVAKPLVLKAGETVEPLSFHPGEVFCVDESHPAR